MHKLVRALLLCLLLPTAVALSQDKPPAAVATSLDNPLSTFNKKVYEGVKGILLRAAEKMPEENYAFKPTEAVRNYGQIIGHVADSQYYFCSVALGEKNPAPQIEKTKTSKADLIAGLNGAFAYCDRAYSSMTDASATQPVTLFGGPTPKIGVLEVNLIHSMEHYGNLVTYMRMKNIIPPTSETGAMPKP
ncbi:MAG: DinB family protein [Terracidiphilus sp.]